MSKVRIGLKEVGKDLIFKEVDGGYESISSIVGGLIEYIPSGIEGLDIIINEEGKLKNMMPNLYYGENDVLCGNVIFIRNVDGDSASINKNDEDFLMKAIPNITIPQKEAENILEHIDNYLGFSIIGFDYGED